MDVIMSCRLATLLACATRRRVVGSLGTVAARLPRVVEALRTVATHCERAAGSRCSGAVLQFVWPHVLLAFNVSPAARIAGARRRPCHVTPLKIRVCPDHGIFVYFNDPQPVEPPWDTWQLRSCPESGGESWSYGAHDGSGAALSQMTGARATGYVTAPKLP
jgi:hypothetical protein